MKNKNDLGENEQELHQDQLLWSSNLETRSVLNATPFPIAIVDLKSDTIIHWSSSANKLFGHTAPTFLEWWQIAFPDENYRRTSIEQWECFLAKARQTKEAVNTGEYRISCKDGSACICEIYAAYLPDSLIVSFLDITARKRAEEALREEKNLFSLLLENSPIYVFFKDNNLRSLRLSRNYEQMLGMPLENALGKTMDDLFPSDMARAMMADDRRLIENNQILRIEEELNGRYYETLKFPVQNETGLPMLAGFTIDITERKLAEKELLKSSERLSLATSSGGLGIWDWSVLENKLLWDERMFELYGITPEKVDINFDDWTSFIHPEDRQKIEYERDLAIAGIKDFRTTFRVIHQNGTIVHIKADGLVIRDQSGKPIRMIGINCDITDRKRTEEALYHSQKLESLGVLAGGIAHDFNNLLGGIYGYIDLAKIEAHGPKSSQFLDKALNSIDRARGLTLQLLTFARGGTPIKKIENMAPFLQETIQFALSGSSVLSQLDIQEGLWLCSFDKNQIGQVIDNIVINAKQAMPNGGVIESTVRNISLANQEHQFLDKGDYVRISVRDYGVGISKEVLSKIFDPFFTTKPKGHGLGLATCYSIVNRHSGCIDVESELGAGSTFHVYLPASNGSAPVSTVKPAPKHSGSSTFIVMDDEETIRDTIGEMLKSFGYTVVLKDNGKDAIDFFTAEFEAGRRVAGMIFDLTIPGAMGGKDAIAEIRKLCLTTPAFVTSGYAEDPVMANPVENGFTASICKPFMTRELAELLNNNLNLKQ